MKHQVKRKSVLAAIPKLSPQTCCGNTIQYQNRALTITDKRPPPTFAQPIHSITVPNPLPSSTKLALLIGCEYTDYEKKGKAKRLPGCHMDIKMAQKMLMEHYGYKREEFIILSDELSTYIQPTKSNILDQLVRVVQECEQRKVSQLLIYYSGHGTQTQDIDGDEEDGMDECMVPCDYMENGLIMDDVFFDNLWVKLPLNIRVTCIFDCCNSGTIFDLPYRYEGKDTIRKDPKMPLSKVSHPLPLIITISGCRDPQTSASAYKLEKQIDWEGAMSYALREVVKSRNYESIPLNVLIDNMRALLAKLRFSQVPQLGLSRNVTPSTIIQLF